MRSETVYDNTRRHGLRVAGRVVGRDCDVVTHDYSEFSGYLNRPLTTCFLGIHKVAATVPDFIQRRIDGAPVSELQKVFEYDLALR